VRAISHLPFILKGGAMRFVRVSLLLLLAVAFAGTALAAPGYHQPKAWAWGGTPHPNAIIPEQEPNDVCPGQSMNCGDEINPAYLNAGDNDWYQFYGTAGTIVTIQTSPITPGDCTDTVLELYYGCGTSYIAFNDDGGGNCLYSDIANFSLPSDGYYQIHVRGYSTSTSGEYKLDLTCAGVNPPDPNDTCNPDFYLTRCTNGVLNGDMTYDHNDYDPGSGGCSTGYPEQGVDVAYRMDLQAGDVVDMTYYTPGWDASFYIITDCSNPAGSCVVGADAAYDTEVIHYVVTSTGTYWLILDHYGVNTGTGPWTLTYTLGCPGPMGACCDANGNCTQTYQTDCQGTWYGGTSCSPNPCPPPTGACCDPATGNCTVTLQADCLSPDTWQGPGTNCSPNLCPPPVPTKNSSWGQIKHQYH
jgi:hypothetical protein